MTPDRPPNTGWSLPRRARLDRALDGARATRLAVVVAPPRWGARGAIAGWAAARGLDAGELAFLDLDRARSGGLDPRTVVARLQPRHLVILRGWREPGIRIAPAGTTARRIGVDDLRWGPAEVERGLGMRGWRPNRDAIASILTLTGGRPLWLDVMRRALSGLAAATRDDVLASEDLVALGLDAVARELLAGCGEDEHAAAVAAGHGAVASGAVPVLEAHGLLDPDADGGRRLDPVVARVLHGSSPVPLSPTDVGLDALREDGDELSRALGAILSSRPSEAVRAARVSDNDEVVARVVRIVLRPARGAASRDDIGRDLEAEARRARRHGFPEAARLIGLIAETIDGHGRRALDAAVEAADDDGVLVLGRALDWIERRGAVVDALAGPSTAEVPAPPRAPVSPTVTIDRDPRIDVRCFGGFRLLIDGEEVSLARLRPRARTLLKVLALNASAPVHRDTLAAILWPDASPTSALHNLHVGLSAARAVIGAAGAGVAERVLVRRDAAYAFDTGTPSRTDFARFDAELRAADDARARRDARGAASHLRAALDLYVGDLLPEDGDAEWVVGARERYRHRAAEASSSLALYALHAGDLHEAADAAIRSVDLERWRDESWRTLIAVHRASGDAVSLDRAERRYGAILRELQDL